MAERTNPPSLTGAAWRNLALIMYWASLIPVWLPFIRTLMDGAAYE